MFLITLDLIGFRNYSHAELTLHEGFNCFTGLNGAGKTNLLDAIHYLCLCKSFFSPSDLQNIRHGEGFFMIQGRFISDGREDQVTCSVKKGQKKNFSINRQEYEKLSDHVGLFPLVMIAPADAELIVGGSGERRRFIDTILSQCDKKYLDTLILYNRQLAQRNALLKDRSGKGNIDQNLLEILDMRLVQWGEMIYKVRKKFIEDFLPFFTDCYSKIAGASENIEFLYESDLENADFTELLKINFEKDCIMQYSTTGIHKDDLIFRMDDHPLKRIASQGQQKTFLLALKLAQAEYIRTVKGVKPLLLLDDLFDKLDNNRIQSILSLLNQSNFGQVFISDTNHTGLTELLEANGIKANTIEVEAGEIK